MKRRMRHDMARHDDALDLGADDDAAIDVGGRAETTVLVADLAQQVLHRRHAAAFDRDLRHDAVERHRLLQKNTHVNLLHVAQSCSSSVIIYY